MVEYFKLWREDGYYGKKKHKAIQRVPEINYGKGITLKSYFDDGTYRHESIRAGYKTSAKVNSAFRVAVEDIVYDFKKSAFKNPFCDCTTCGKSIQLNEAHVDHYNLMFVDVVKGFLQKYNLNYEDIRTTRRINKGGDCLYDVHILESFIEHHNANTNLRITCRDCNLSRKHNNRL